MESSAAATSAAIATPSAASSDSSFNLAPSVLPRTWIDNVVDWGWWTSMQPGDFSEGPTLVGIVLLVSAIGVSCIVAAVDWVKRPPLAKQLNSFGWSMIVWGIVGLLLLAGRAAGVSGLSPRIWWVGYSIGVLLTVWYFWELRWSREKERHERSRQQSLKEQYLK